MIFRDRMYAMILRRAFHVLLILVSAVLIQACGNAADSGDNLGRDPRPGGGGGGGGNYNNGRTVDLIVEGTTGIAGEDSLVTRLIGFFLPQQAYALAGQKTLKVKSIKVIQLSDNGQVLEASSIPAYTVKYNNPDGSHTITFSSQYDSRLDLAIEVTLPNDELLRRPLPTTTRTGPTDNQTPHVVNVATEYAVRAFFQHVQQDSGRRQLFNDLVKCSSLDFECKTQAAASLANLLALAEGANDFEIEIPDELALEEVILLLNDQLDFRRFVQKSSETVLAAKIGGQNSKGEIPDVLKSVVGNYNGVSFAMELNQGVQDPDQPTAILSNWTSSSTSITTDGVITYEAPTLVVANMGFGIVSSLLVGNLPSVRNTLTLISGSAPAVQASTPDDQRNLLDYTNAYAGYTLAGTYDYGLLQYQSVTGEKSADVDTIGWLNNPYFNSIYDATAQSALLSARVTTGLAYRLSGTKAPYTREELREKMHRFTFTAYSKRVDTNPDDSSKKFDPTQLRGKRYGVVMLTQKFSATGDPVVATGSIRQWQTDANESELADTQPSPSVAGDLDIFKSWTPSYANSGMTDTQTSSPIDREYRALLSRLSRNNKTYSAQNGLLELTTPDTQESWEGISDPNGAFLSFAINTSVSGQGIAHAIPLLTSGNLDRPSKGDVFHLTGNGIGFTSTENYLYHVDDSSLAFDLNNQVTLTLKRVKVSQNRANLEVSGLTEDAEPLELTTTAEYGTGDIKNSVRMVFTDDAGDDITLEGFVTLTDPENPEAGGRVMVLLMRHANSIGLMYALQDKQLDQQ